LAEVDEAVAEFEIRYRFRVVGVVAEVKLEV
jgi:hypothetical protein